MITSTFHGDIIDGPADRPPRLALLENNQLS